MSTLFRHAAPAMCSALLLAACATPGPVDYETVDRPTAGIFLDETRAALPEGVELRALYDKGLQLTKDSEGFRSKLYNDAAGFCTIAYGHLIKKARCNGSEPEEFRSGVSEPRGAEMLTGDMGLARWTVMSSVKTTLTDGQFAALCDFVYNAGAGNFNRSTLLALVNKRQFDDIPAQFRRWTMAGGKTFPGLIRRRDGEIALFFDGMPMPKAAPMEGEDLRPIDIRTGEVR